MSCNPQVGDVVFRGGRWVDLRRCNIVFKGGGGADVSRCNVLFRGGGGLMSCDGEDAT